MINDEGKEIDVKTLEQEDENDSTPLSIEEIDNVSMVKPKEEPAETEEEYEEESDEDDYEDEFDDEFEDDFEDSFDEGSEE